MDYYNSQSAISPNRKSHQISPGSHGNASGKSSASKRISSDIHLFLAQHDDQEEFAIRNPSSLPTAPQKKENKNVPRHETNILNINRAISLQTLPTQTVPQGNSKKEPMSPKKTTELKGEQSKYAGGGYTTSPNPKALSKPSLSSPVKKEKKLENKMEEVKSSQQQRFTHSVHSYSTPNLMPPMPYPTHSFNMMPMTQFMLASPNYNGQTQFYESAFPIPSMTREEANQDLRSRINIL